MENHENYVSLETAKLLKQAGFDWTIDCDFVYAIFNDRTEFLNDIYVINAYQSNLRPGLGPLDRDSYVCKYHAPTLSVAQEWLRVTENIWIEVTMCFVMEDAIMKTKYHVQIVSTNFGELLMVDCHDIETDTPKEALEAGIKKYLTLILEKDDSKI